METEIRTSTELPNPQFVGDLLPGPQRDVFTMLYIVYYCPISAIPANLSCTSIPTIPGSNDCLH